MATWMHEYKALSSPTKKGEPLSSKIFSPTKTEQIEAELRLLEWHRLANNAAIKASLLQTKTIKQEHTPGSKSNTKAFTDDGSRRLRKIAEDELSRPLHLTKDIKLGIQKQEKENSEKLSHQVDRHISTLKRLRAKLEERAEMKSRNDEFKDWKKTFAAKKEAILSGTLPNASKLGGDKNVLSMLAEDQSSVGNANADERKQPPELSTVLQSLNKLSELEGRILGLERENRLNETITADRTINRTAGVTNGRGNQKGRVVPSRPNYSLPPVQGNKGKAFLTDGMSAAIRSARKDKAILLAKATNGQRELKARVQARKTRDREISIGDRRHEGAMRDLQKKRAEQAGLGAGRAKEFQQLKQGYQKRREVMYKQLQSNRPVVSTQPKFGTVPSRPSEPSAAAIRRQRLGIAVRTIPAASQGLRKPLVRNGGSITRRVDGALLDDPPKLLESVCLL